MYIKDKVKHMVSIYRFDGVGKYIDKENAVLSDLDLGDGDYFIA